MIYVVLQRNSGNMWKLFVKSNKAPLSERRWKSKVDALAWAKAFMSNHNQPYKIEIIDECEFKND